jgi:hypothetical protein
MVKRSSIKRGTRIILPAVLAALLMLGLLPTELARAQNDAGDRDRGAPSAPAAPSVKVRPPDPIPGGDRWILGVRIENADVGIRIREVVPRSAADRVGLERGDLILTVNGYQIGRVLTQYYSLEDELQRRANSRGEVRLLVQDRRTNRLLNLDVRLDRGDRHGLNLIRGEAMLRERMALPPDAELHVEFRRRTPTRTEVIARETYRRLGGSPYAFELRYPERNAWPDGVYEVDAEIRSRGNRLFVAERPQKVHPGRDVNDVRIMLRRR